MLTTYLNIIPNVVYISATKHNTTNLKSNMVQLLPYSIYKDLKN